MLNVCLLAWDAFEEALLFVFDWFGTRCMGTVKDCEGSPPAPLSHVCTQSLLRLLFAFTAWEFVPQGVCCSQRGDDILVLEDNVSLCLPLIWNKQAFPLMSVFVWHLSVCVTLPVFSSFFFKRMLSKWRPEMKWVIPLIFFCPIPPCKPNTPWLSLHRSVN